MFKIRNNETGLFSAGGSRPGFSNTGKIWTKRGHVTSHLAQMTQINKERFYANCTVVEFEIQEVDTHGSPINWQEAESTTRARELQKQRSKQNEIEFLESRQRQLEKELAAIKKKTANNG